ncbi:hypothetical protein, partial [Thiolapillus sp.]|uniref:hypothetical protein n=1 Tax=Thiolapillus sp. TaxID=2017437 RepID=UPI003AF59746
LSLSLSSSLSLSLSYTGLNMDKNCINSLLYPQLIFISFSSVLLLLSLLLLLLQCYCCYFYRTSIAGMQTGKLLQNLIE